MLQGVVLLLGLLLGLLLSPLPLLLLGLLLGVALLWRNRHHHGGAAPVPAPRWTWALPGGPPLRLGPTGFVHGVQLWQEVPVRLHSTTAASGVWGDARCCMTVWGGTGGGDAPASAGGRPVPGDSGRQQKEEGNNRRCGGGRARAPAPGSGRQHEGADSQDAVATWCWRRWRCRHSPCCQQWNSCRSCRGRGRGRAERGSGPAAGRPRIAPGWQQ